eukprot:5473707-Prymnesium_polylepis.1
MVGFFKAQRTGLPNDYPMHLAVRVYHTTRSDLADDDWNWRDHRRPCEIEHNLNPNKQCGEELYFPLDVHMLLAAPLHPQFLIFLLSLATRQRVEALLRLLLGWGKDASLVGVECSLLALLCALVLHCLVRGCWRCVRCYARHATGYAAVAPGLVASDEAAELAPGPGVVLVGSAEAVEDAQPLNGHHTPITE